MEKEVGKIFTQCSLKPLPTVSEASVFLNGLNTFLNSDPNLYGLLYTRQNIFEPPDTTFLQLQAKAALLETSVCSYKDQSPSISKQSEHSI